VNKPIIIHLHVPKCAGGSINRILEKRFSDRNLSPRDRDSALAALTRAQRDERYDSLSGHNLWGIHKKFHRDAVYVSVIRDPVSRLCSYFNFVHCSPKHRLYEDLQDLPDLSALTAEWLGAHPTVKRGWSNEACRTYFGGRFDPAEYDALERRVIDEMLDERFIVGPLPLVERWLRQNDILRKDEAMPHDKRTVDLGRRAQKFVWAQPEKLSDTARTVLREMSALDYRLYEAIAWTNYVTGVWTRPQSDATRLQFGLSGTSAPLQRGRRRLAAANDRIGGGGG